MKRPVVLDANSLIVRCIMSSALDDLKSGAIFTGGLYAAIRSLRSILSDALLFRAGRVYAFFDCGVPAFRKALLPDYKAHREERRSMLTPEQKEKAGKQIAAFERVLPLLGVKTFKYQNREADDGVAAACRILVDAGERPVVVTGDKDLLQLVNASVSVLLLNERELGLVDADNFEERVGVRLEHYLLYKALIGDPSDGIKGADGCGPSRASSLLSESSLSLSSPNDQLHELQIHLQSQKKLRKFEQSILADILRLHDVVRAIDLSNSRGSTRTLAYAMETPETVRRMDFLRFCGKYKFKSIVSDPENMLRPFVACAG